MKHTKGAALLASAAATSLIFGYSGFAFANENSDTNLAQNATITTSVTGVQDNLFNSYESTYLGNVTGLTDWRGFCRQGGRDITILLPQNSTVDSISIQMQQAPTLGVRYPDSVEFEVNQNNQWYVLGSVHSSIPSTDTRQTVQTFQIHFDHASGQQFRIHFPVGVWVFARNLQVMGVSGGGGNVIQPTVPAPSPNSNTSSPMSPTDKRDAGIHNMLLVYTGGYGSQGTWSQGDFLPMVAYQPQTGPVTGRMFDTMLFLPYGTVPNTQAGWSTYLQDLFSPNQQLSALDQAVAQENQALGTASFQENVVLTIPYAPYGINDWGQIGGQDINFSGSTSDPNGLSAREEAVSWYLNTLLANWKQENFQHLHLCGIYWNNETFSNSSPGELDFIQATLNLTHQNQLPLFWIPFYGANGSLDWQRIGFDAAWLQPNFIEQGENADASRLKNTESAATSIAAGVELELNGFDQTNEALYQQTLQEFAADGFSQKVSHAYYDGSKMLVYAADATDAATRALYDNTYWFISHS